MRRCLERPRSRARDRRETPLSVVGPFAARAPFTDARGLVVPDDSIVCLLRSLSRRCVERRARERRSCRVLRFVDERVEPLRRSLGLAVCVAFAVATKSGSQPCSLRHRVREPLSPHCPRRGRPRAFALGRGPLGAAITLSSRPALLCAASRASLFASRSRSRGSCLFRRSLSSPRRMHTTFVCASGADALRPSSRTSLVPADTPRTRRAR